MNRSSISPRRARSAGAGQRLPAVLLIAWGAQLTGCERERQQPTAPDTTPPIVAIASPSTGATVADSVAVVITAADDVGVARVTLLVDHATLATRYGPPWVLTWDTSACEDSSRHILQVEAVDPTGNLGLSAETAVVVRRNGPPRVEIEWPPDCLWLDADRPGPPWRCAAWDPDEGPLAADAVTWRLDGARLGAGCLHLDPPPLTPGDHRLTVVAQDRWGRRGSATHRLTVFEEPGRASPEAAWMSLLCALRARASERIAGCLVEGFRVHPPADGRAAAAISGADAAVALGALVGDSSLALFVLECRWGPVEIFELRGRRRAKIELRDLALRMTYRASAPQQGAPLAGATSAREVRGSAARVFLCDDPAAEGSWRLEAWWDLHGSTWVAGWGPSWTAVLQEALARARGAPAGG